MIKVIPLIGLLLARLGQAFILPEDLADGVHLFATDGSGEAISSPMAADALGDRSLLLPPLSLSKSNSRILPRQQSPPPLPSPRVTCGSANINANEFANAQAIFNTMCDRAQQYPANYAVVISQGSSVAYMCNFQGSTNRCWREEYNEANRLIDAACGAGRSGTVRVDAYTKLYGRGNTGENIC